ncbi:hypothetical protein, partial [Treponema socranskii]|uniref:hypothetical protein n=1 Tax=Treponema socranskii TaxID=53419 RepID=UPI0028E3E0CC
MKEKRAKRFSPLDLKEQIRTVRDLQRARSAKFPAQDLRASPMKEKRAKRFSPLDLKEQIRTVRDLQRARSAKFPAQDLRASP